MNPQVDNYLINGCGRCSLGGTPQCKVNNWPQELNLLRSIVQDCELEEELKWGVPCYTHNGKIILLISAFKKYCTINFFKGALLKDPQGILSKPGHNTNESRNIRFTNTEQIVENEAVIKAYITEAIGIEKAGLKVAPTKVSDYPMPEELLNAMNTDPNLKAAFENLTPGRQKAYLLHFAQAKQSKTRAARIEKWIPQILAGKGFHDR